MSIFMDYKPKDSLVPIRIFANEYVRKHLFGKNEMVLSETEFENNYTLKQSKNISRLPNVFKRFYLMPDMHQGYGFPIGGVAGLKGAVSPGGIGYDINCGVRLLFLPVSLEEFNEKKLEVMKRLEQAAPTGVGSKSKARFSEKDFNGILDYGVKHLVSLGYANEEDLNNIEDEGSLAGDHNFISEKALKRGIKELGTVGAGNHFVEVQKLDSIFDTSSKDFLMLSENVFKQKDPKEGLFIMIHTGSRGLGHQVATDYIGKIRDELPEIFENLEEKDLSYIPSDSHLFDEFFKAMNAAANFGFANRQILTYNIRKMFSEVFSIDKDSIKLIYDVAHNIAKKEDHVIDGEKESLIVHRKGATRAFGSKLFRHKYFDSQPVILPGSFATESFLLFAKDNDSDLSLQSCSHGSGRILSRKQAHDLDFFKIKSNLRRKNILVNAKSRDTLLEESPECYKDVDEVVKTIEDANIARKVMSFEPILSTKG